MAEKDRLQRLTDVVQLGGVGIVEFSQRPPLQFRRRHARRLFCLTTFLIAILGVGQIIYGVL